MSEVQREINRHRRKRNWAAISAMGKIYKTIYLVVALFSVLIIGLGILGLVLDWGGFFDYFWMIGLAIGIIFNGGMTIIANIVQFFKKEY